MSKWMQNILNQVENKINNISKKEKRWFRKEAINYRNINRGEYGGGIGRVNPIHIIYDDINNQPANKHLEEKNY
jgi:hypothetical protein